MQDGHKVCLLETDPQGTVSNWRARRTPSEPMVETAIAGFEIERKLPFLEHSGVDADPDQHRRRGKLDDRGGDRRFQFVPDFGAAKPGRY